MAYKPAWRPFALFLRKLNGEGLGVELDNIGWIIEDVVTSFHFSETSHYLDMSGIQVVYAPIRSYTQQNAT